MLELEINEEGLSLLLQASRDFAFQQIASGLPMMPFATCVKPGGDMDFVRFAEPGTDKTPDEVVELTEMEMTQAAGREELIAAAISSAVKLKQPEDGMTDAIRIKVEAPGFAREFLAFYALEEGKDGEAGTLSPGKLVPFDSQPAIFAG